MLYSEKHNIYIVSMHKCIIDDPYNNNNIFDAASFPFLISFSSHRIQFVLLLLYNILYAYCHVNTYTDKLRRVKNMS